MKNILFKIIKIIFFLFAGLLLFWQIYKNQDPEELKSALINDVNYFWIIISILIGLISHLSRTIRWRLMIEPISHKPNLKNTFLSVMVGYLMNLALPRMGEVTRCGVLARYEKLNFSKLIGTVVAERAVDLISLLVLLGIVIFSQFGKMLNFLNQYPEIESKLMSFFSSPILIIGIVILLIGVYFFRRTLKDTLFYKKVTSVATDLKLGFISIRAIKSKGWFVFHSIAIWVLYYLMFYTVFFAFEFTSDLSPIAGLTSFVMASFGMVAPVQGGIGPWHFMAIEGLRMYGIAFENARIFALVAHSSMTIMIFIVGIVSFYVLPFINRKDVNSAKPMPVNE